jgi:hypothetical protein
MKTITRSLLRAILMAPFSMQVSAQGKPDAHAQHAKPSASANALTTDITQAAQPAVNALIGACPDQDVLMQCPILHAIAEDEP